MSLSSIARSKLSLSPSSNLHRWVLLKNSITSGLGSDPSLSRAALTPPNSPIDSEPSPSSSSSSSSSSSTTAVTAPSTSPDQGAFMFPTYYSYPDEDVDTQTRSSEALWLDTLLESLAHDEEDEVEEAPIEEEEDEEEEEEETDMLSPMSSSDDLSQPHTHTFIQYYPPPTQTSPLAPLPLALPFPFSELDVLDDTIEELSDDGDPDPDALNSSSSTSSTSPSSSASSLPPSTPPSSPLRTWTVPKLAFSTSSSSSTAPTPTSHTPKPHIYIDAYSDPLPFPHNYSGRYEFDGRFVFHPC